MRLSYLDALRRSLARSYGHAIRQVGPLSWEVDHHGDCTSPVRLVEYARKDRKGNLRTNEWQPGDETPLTIYRATRCRSCGPCLRFRGRLWWRRARAEVAMSSRTWFGTLTLDPWEHFQCELRAREHVRNADAVEWSSLPPGEQFLERHKIIGEELTRYLKRLRKARNTSFRYLLVAEVHEGKRGSGLNIGLPHYHMLLHEQLLRPPMTWATLDDQWKLGFTTWKLVDSPKMVGYVTKYVAKSALARVRASGRYGQGLIRKDEETISIHREQVGPVKKRMTPPQTSLLRTYSIEETFDED